MATFPELPNYQATAFYVTWNPVLGSDERITVLVGVAGADGEVSVTRTLSPTILSLMVGAQSKSANELIDIAAKSLLEHLKSGQDVSLWSAPVTGFNPSKSMQYRGNDIGDITRQIGLFHSVFFHSTLCDA